MKNAKMIAGTLALSLTAAAMIALAPAESSKAAVSAADATPRGSVAYKTDIGHSTNEIVEAACQFGGCQDI
ncbi:MAG: hypothetical protein AAF441_21675 [Pseudomonadota bacterium]